MPRDKQKGHMVIVEVSEVLPCVLNGALMHMVIMKKCIVVSDYSSVICLLVDQTIQICMGSDLFICKYVMD